MYQATFSFPQFVDRSTKAVKLSKDTKSINECLGVLLRTRPGELFGDPEYGCNLIDRIFEYNGIVIDTLLKEDIINAVSKYEPRVIMTYGDIEIYKTPQVVHIFIQYLIKDTGEVNQFNIEVTPDDKPGNRYGNL